MPSLNSIVKHSKNTQAIKFFVGYLYIVFYFIKNIAFNKSIFGLIIIHSIMEEFSINFQREFEVVNIF